MELTPDEVNTVLHLIEDWGWEYGLKSDVEKMKALALKLDPDNRRNLTVLRDF